MRTYQKLLLFVAALVLALPLFSAPAQAYHDTYDDRYNSPPIYQSGYHSYTYSYGWTGWNYNRVYYKYHYPYSTYNYGYQYANYYRPPGFVRYYGYGYWPGYQAYPWGGYYW